MESSKRRLRNSMEMRKMKLNGSLDTASRRGNRGRERRQRKEFGT